MKYFHSNENNINMDNTRVVSVNNKQVEFASRLGKVYSIQHYVIKFVDDLRQVGGFLRALQFPPNKTDCHDITEILLKVVLNTITLTLPKAGSVNAHI